MEATSPTSSDRHRLYQEASQTYGAALARLARAYEIDSDKQRDLLQDIHLALWRSFETFEQRCSLRTWVYRVAHNTATSHVIRARRTTKAFSSLAEIEATTTNSDPYRTVEGKIDVERLLALVQQLRPDDRQIMLLYLEGMDSAEIGEITGITAGHVRTQIHRIKKILSDRLGRTQPAQQGGRL